MIDASIIAAAKPTVQPCSLDAIDGSYSKQVTVSVGKPHVFRRWLLNSSREPAGKFSLVLKGNHDFAIPATTGQSCPDCGAYLKNHALGTAGFAFAPAIESVPSGGYKLAFLITPATTHLCETGKMLVVD